jgi:hypothetical protein
MVPLLVTLKVTVPAGAEVALSAITNSVSVAEMVVPDGDAASDGDCVVPGCDAAAPGDEAVELHAASTTTSPIDAINVAWLLFMGDCLSYLGAVRASGTTTCTCTFVVKPRQANGPNGTFTGAKRPLAACRRLTATGELSSPEVSLQL